jgi:hypothetical protein
MDSRLALEQSLEVLKALQEETLETLEALQILLESDDMDIYGTYHAQMIVLAKGALVALREARTYNDEVYRRGVAVIDRYTWVTNRMLVCDYGDNADQVAAWRIRKEFDDQAVRRTVFLYGPTIDVAIDTVLRAYARKDCLVE